MKEIPTSILVVAVALFDSQGRVLLQQRLPGKHHAGLWEFPGGKVESTEMPREALVREIAEELGLELDPALLQPAFFAEEGGNPAIVLNLYTSHQAAGEGEARDGQAFGWFAPDEAAGLELAPMDRALLEKLRR
ncbi:(deoxy)nucleoside triphosphate pyrophosphohydrolase [Aurantiacibacter sp. MUD11]|uniref:(deoxy)nucleoside triphosphate pyrophosphohydrolase n=1 Tax=Aurantiacibacter sp. MUD11 TaxID=3003265 RepID=UPI0022AA513D|nr:(deoxy)nucleoside triphosphate pyrophosphohydrolase [Aurantiacibacter sp. MUD11]WAT18557.1 (deoxy)nucleoside triphosphate pyrophosphohydrolase [Aurantiacibacter sp. MUD11]